MRSRHLAAFLPAITIGPLMFSYAKEKIDADNEPLKYYYYVLLDIIDISCMQEGTSWGSS